ncbi:MAG: MmgE/PrpD family protein [Rhodospirillales bacterium]|nr:MmgE/PrpD family protein [Rhodospirillales bacterium]
MLTRLGAFVAGARFELDPGTVNVVRDALLDTFGCIISGAAEAVARRAQDAMSGDAGTAEVFGTALCTTPGAAALLNAVAGHALEFDDWEIPGNSHPTVVMVPALLAAARECRPAGRDMRDAYVAGFEVIARLGDILNFDHYDRGWHTTGTIAAVGAAASVARLWKLDPATTTHALSLAVSRAAGLTRQFGSDAKPLQAGFAAEAGITCARLARCGMTAVPDVLEKDQGYATLTSCGEAQIASAMESLGHVLALAEHGLVFKPYPSCGYTHRIIDCALNVRERMSPAADQIAGIAIYLPAMHAGILPFRQPDDARQARFSLPFCATQALVHGHVTADDFVRERWQEPDVARLIGLSTVHSFAPLNPRLNYDPDDPDRLSVTLADGTVHEVRVAYPLGSPQRPMTSAQILDKFRQNTTRFPADGGTIDRLSAWPDADDLLSLLEPWSTAP